MIIKIIQTTDSGLIKDTVKTLPDWVSKELIRNGLAEKYNPATGKGVTYCKCKPMTNFDFNIKTPARGKNKKVAYMATFPPRKDVILKSIESLISQVDAIVVWANGYSEKEAEALTKQYDKKLYVYRQDGVDIGCAGKFAFCQSWLGYVFTVDDDFIYPNDYVEKMIEAVEAYNRKAVVSLHGRRVITPVLNYYTDRGEFFRCTEEVSSNEKVDIVGTGVMALHTDTLNPPLSGREIFTYSNMSDILFSIEMKKRGVPMYVVKHPAKWLIALHQKVSIGARTKRDCELETALINQNWK